ncbi:hypothetical protein FRAHR75_620021 [Frankia sp. Hr75.2]|nr:hypothetical protein FRAHR75_620021 [Frankia sp. Hr75.2]
MRPCIPPSALTRPILASTPDRAEAIAVLPMPDSEYTRPSFTWSDVTPGLVQAARGLPALEPGEQLVNPVATTTAVSPDSVLTRPKPTLSSTEDKLGMTFYGAASHAVHSS